MKEEAIVKQSASSAIGGFAGVTVSGLMGVCVYLTPEKWQELAKLVAVIALISVTAVLYRSNNKVRPESL